MLYLSETMWKTARACGAAPWAAPASQAGMLATFANPGARTGRPERPAAAQGAAPQIVAARKELKLSSTSSEIMRGNRVLGPVRPTLLTRDRSGPIDATPTE